MIPPQISVGAGAFGDGNIVDVLTVAAPEHEDDADPIIRIALAVPGVGRTRLPRILVDWAVIRESQAHDWISKHGVEAGRILDRERGLRLRRTGVDSIPGVRYN